MEGTWGRKLGVAQASIREAINLLAQEGFVIKVSGRSARPVRLTEQDVLQLYEVRGAVEGLAARLAASRHADAAKLQKMVDAMRRGSRRNRTADLVDADPRIPSGALPSLCQSSLGRARKPCLIALFRIRIIASKQSTSAWDRDLEAHQRVVDLVREGEGEIAEQYVRRAMARFAETAYSNWEKMPQPSKGKSRRTPE